PDGQPGISVHIDTGGPSNGTRYGSWGGAHRIGPFSGGSYCTGLSQQRTGYFHHGLLNDWTGQAQATPHWCYNGTFSSGFNNAHETGHNLNLSHGGNRASVQANCKPHYLSIMSYAGPPPGNPSFSPGTFVTNNLNPTALNEVAGLGTT